MVKEEQQTEEKHLTAAGLGLMPADMKYQFNGHAAAIGHPAATFYQNAVCQFNFV